MDLTSGDGSGSGYGSGYGDGSGNGYGDGYGDGEAIGSTDEGDVRVLAEWSAVAVGCQVHTLAHWREHWAGIAASHGVRMSAAEATALLDRAEAMCAEMLA